MAEHLTKKEVEARRRAREQATRDRRRAPRDRETRPARDRQQQKGSSR